jgi:hypothetical protein
MSNHTVIWNHEKAQARQIAQGLVAQRPDISGWRVIKLPMVGFKLMNWKNKVRLAQRNLLFTKELAFMAAKSVDQGEDRALELGRADLKTREVLNNDKQGYYSEKIRKKQLLEIELLFDHYLLLMKSQGSNYKDLIRSAYKDKGSFSEFLEKLEDRESAVIQAALSSMRKASKKERADWFKRVRKLTSEARETELNRIFNN